ncbi:MAG TPA: lasso peptide biosynthesis B2 protein [Acidimicrobiales bacterium]|nr:lasso peptide biosynthesis B2 protein [Acidimicrobiales bacterium]
MVIATERRALAPRYAPATFRAAWWAYRSVRRARRELRDSGVRARIAPPPKLPWGAGRGVNAVLRRQEPTCLERSLVMQAWLAAQGEAYDVIVGVTRTATGIDAHAWVDLARDSPNSAKYEELVRLPPT